MAGPASAKPKRRRRTPEDARAEILRGAERLLRRRPWSEVTVERVMAETTLARESFYMYFPTRHALLAAVLAELRDEIDSYGERWRDGGGDVYDDGRAGIRALVELYRRHGTILRALSEAALQDGRAARAWRRFTRAGEQRTADKIREDVERGLIVPCDADETARALCAMNREYLFQVVVGRRVVDVDAVVDLLHGIWWRTLYAERLGEPG